MENILTLESTYLLDTISHFIKDGVKHVQEYEINCSDLDERFLTENIRDFSEYELMFKKLAEIEQNPCIYSFELQTNVSPDIIVEKITEFAKNSSKKIPAIKTNYPKDSNFLYVGKVNSCIWGRLITHLGFHTLKNGGNPISSSNHGLQLYFWAKSLSLKIKFKVIPFESDMTDLMEVLERKLAKELNPIIGKHI